MRGISAASDSRAVLIPSGSGALMLNSSVPSSKQSILSASFTQADDDNDNEHDRGNPPSRAFCSLVTLATAIQPGTAAGVIVMASLSKASYPRPQTEICLQVLKNASYEMACVPITMPFLDVALDTKESKPDVRKSVRASSLTVQLEFCSHDPSLLVVSESYLTADNDEVNHRIHLFCVTASEEGKEADSLSTEHLNSHSLRECLSFSEVGGVMKEASEILEAVNIEEEEGSDIMEMLINGEAKASSKVGDAKNINDEALHSRKLSFAWIPSTRRLVTVQWGEVWYWSVNIGGGNRGLILDNQDSHNVNVKTNSVTSVVASVTSVFLPPLKKVSGFKLGDSTKSMAAEGNCVILVCGNAPASLLKIDPCLESSTNLTATLSCQIKNKVRKLIDPEHTRVNVEGKVKRPDYFVA